MTEIELINPQQPATSTNTLGDNRIVITSSSQGGGGGAVAWGDITGTLTAQTDLNTALGLKVPTARTITAVSPIAGGGDLSANRTITTLMATNKLIGRGTAGNGVMEEITLGTNLSLTGTTLNASGGGSQTLAQTLLLGNLTGGANILMTTGDYLKSDVGDTHVDLSGSSFVVTTDNGAFGTPYLTVGATQIELASLSGGGIILANGSVAISHNTLIVFDVAPVRFNALTASTVPYLDASKNLVSSAVTPTQLSYLDATSSVQTQLNSKGSGTVTAIGVTTANGVSGSSSGGATPNLTITLGAITPTTVNGLTITTTTGTLTLVNGSSLITSGANSLTLTTTGATNVTFPTSGVLSTSGYTLTALQIVNLNPADATTYFWGQRGNGSSVTASGTAQMYIPKTGTIKSVYGRFYQSGVSGAETSTIYIRLNNTTDTAISATVTNDAAVTAFSNTGLSIAVTAGDYIEIKWITPTWAPNPTGVQSISSIYIEG